MDKQSKISHVGQFYVPSIEEFKEVTDYIGYSGGIILSICLIPQIYQICKTKHVENISYLWQFMYISGISLHLYYSIDYGLLPIIVPTIIELFFVILLLILKLIYMKHNKNNKVDIDTES